MTLIFPALGLATASVTAAVLGLSPCERSSGSAVMALNGQSCRSSCSTTPVTTASGVRMASLGVMAAPNTIVDVAAGADQFSLLVSAVKAAGLVDALSDTTELTVFAPTDDAFGRAAADGVDLQFLLSDAGRPALQRVLLHHVVPGRLDSATLAGRSELTTLAGTTLTLDLARQRLFVEDAMVQTADVGADNGVVHIIDRVMLPPAQASPAEQIIAIAIERGVPMFNSNNAEGCAAVYATALDAIASVEGFGLTGDARQQLRQQLDRIPSMGTASEQAWAYRRIMDEMVRTMSR